VVNAMVHGNEGDPGLTIDLRVAVDDQRWSVTVADRGSGFTADQVPDVSDPESLLLEHGRGIRLLGEWLDELTYYRGGSVAYLTRTRADLPRP
jgi:anti-sigma regulatory factor (Ser/Thr protein kinase)